MKFTPSDQTTHSIKEGQEYIFGYLQVPEVRSDPESKLIRLPVYYFKSRSVSPKPDPVLYTVGGPGNTTMSSSPYMRYYRYLDDRDFILFEQRGTQFAQPHLDCPEWSRAIAAIDSSRSYKDGESLLAEAARACRERLTGKGINLDAYNTLEIAADINDLIQVLGIEKYNLLTLSYSTKIAQVLMRDYPERIRSVVMDSPLPLEASYDEESVGNLLNSISNLLSDCENDPICEARFPNLKDRFFHFLRESNKNPIPLPLSYEETADTLYLRGEDFISLFTSQGTDGVASIPLRIDQVLNGDFSEIAKRYDPNAYSVGDGRGIGMRLCVWCAEEYPFSRRRKVRKQTSAYPELLGLSSEVFPSPVCDIWKVKAMPGSENRAIQSDIPVLLMSGSYDNETPVRWAASMKENLSRSHHLIFRGWKHTPTTYWSNPCGMEAANAFFNNPDQKPDVACLREVLTPKFKTKFD